MIRAGGFTAAAVLVASAAFADPSVAGELVPTPTSSHFMDHAAAVVAEPPQDRVDAAMPAPEVDLSIASMDHAIATVEAATAEISLKHKAQSLGALVEAYAGADAADAELACLAGAVYFESKGEPLAGQLAVAEVIINRSKSGRFPASLCGVVKQKSQFSFVRRGHIPAIPDNAAWRKAVAIAHIAQQDLADSEGSEALFFHAAYVRPGWRGLTRVASVGNHIFYR
ncbi:MAG TPA: cell wall hydrolase [Allosphingosinicella sp.]|nr:cell wall hydrolase [Allosphingosinicella sp.]